MRVKYFEAQDKLLEVNRECTINCVDQVAVVAGLFFKIDSFYPLRNTGHYFIRYRICPLCHFLQW